MRNRQRRLSVRKPTAVQVGYVEFFVIPIVLMQSPDRSGADLYRLCGWRGARTYHRRAVPDAFAKGRTSALARICGQ